MNDFYFSYVTTSGVARILLGGNHPRLISNPTGVAVAGSPGGVANGKFFEKSVDFLSRKFDF